MKTFQAVFLAFLLTLAPGQSYAQFVNTNFDKKIIRPDSLNLPQNTTISDVLNLLPELLQRPGDFILSNYDIQIEELSIGDAADVALQNLQIVDVEKIEISESPITSYKKNGQGGSINLYLRSKSHNGKKTWGSAGANLENSFDFGPQFNIGHKSDKVLVRGIFLSEFYNYKGTVQQSSFIDNRFQDMLTTQKHEEFSTELGRVYMNFKLTPQDVLNVNLSESYSYTDEGNKLKYDESTMLNAIEKKTILKGQLRYRHITPRTELRVESVYDYNPSKKDNLNGGRLSLHNNAIANNLSGKVEYSTQLLNAEQANRLKLIVGTTYNLVFTDKDIHDESSNSLFNMDFNTYYYMPYLKMEGVFGKFLFKGIAEYQSFRYKIREEQDPFATTSNDFTGKLVTEWLFTPSRKLQLTLDRKLSRPSSEQLYPFLIQAPQKGYYSTQIGNPDLKPVLSNEIKLDFISHHRWDKHSLTLNAGVSYNYVSNIITTCPLLQVAPIISEHWADLDNVDKFTTYTNDGTNKITSANLMAMYSYDNFALSFTGNLFHNDQLVKGVTGHQTYYNLQIYPHFNLRNGWNGGAKFSYYSKIDKGNMSVGNCGVAYMQVGKAWDNFHLYLYQQVNIKEHSEDIAEQKAGTYTLTSYNLVPNLTGIGFKYVF